jgi:hypothetical protein
MLVFDIMLMGSHPHSHHQAAIRYHHLEDLAAVLVVELVAGAELVAGVVVAAAVDIVLSMDYILHIDSGTIAMVKSA